MSSKSSKTSKNPKIAVGYLRASKEDQKLSPEAQRSEIEDWAAKNGVTIAAWFQDHGECGATPLEQRPGLLAAISSTYEHNAGLILILRRDRLGRDTLVSALIDREVERAGATIFSVRDPVNGKDPASVFTRNILDAVAQFERERISTRTKEALAVKKARGERVGRPSLSEQIPSSTLQLIKTLYLSGNFTQAQLAEELNRRNIPTATAKGRWHKRTVQVALASM